MLAAVLCVLYMRILYTFVGGCTYTAYIHMVIYIKHCIFIPVLAGASGFRPCAKPSQTANALNPALNYDLLCTQTYGKYIVLASFCLPISWHNYHLADFLFG